MNNEPKECQLLALCLVKITKRSFGLFPSVDYVAVTFVLQNLKALFG